MSPPIRDGSGNSIGSIRLGDGTEIAEVRTGAGDVLFSGSTIPGSAVVRYNAKKLSGFNGGDTVLTRPDQTGNGFGATGSGTYRSSGINGYASVDYDGVGDIHDVSFTSVSQRVVVFAVVQPDSTTATDVANTIAAPASNRTRMAGPAFGNAYNIDAGSSGAGGGTADTNPHLITGIFDGSNTELREDGITVIGPSSLGTNSWDGITIGDEFDGSNSEGNYEGLIGFVELHDGNPSNGLSTREQEIANLWDITI